MSGNISTFDSKSLSFVTSIQINTSPVLNLSTEFENEVFEKKSLGISEHHTKISSNKNDNFIENEEVFTDFEIFLSFENTRNYVNLVVRSRLISLKGKLKSNSTL